VRTRREQHGAGASAVGGATCSNPRQRFQAPALFLGGAGRAVGDAVLVEQAAAESSRQPRRTRPENPTISSQQPRCAARRAA
jgi:hypothetical protein